MRFSRIMKERCQRKPASLHDSVLCDYAKPPRSLLSVASPYFARVVGV